FRIRGHHERDDLRLVAPAGREERTNRTVDDAAREDFLLGRLSFALEESAGYAARGVAVLAVVDREWQGNDPLARARRAAGPAQAGRIALANHDGAARLLGELAGFETESMLADVNFAYVHCRYLRMLRRLMRSAYRCASLTRR